MGLLAISEQARSLPIYRDGELGFVRIGDVNDDLDRGRFQMWMIGQTRPLIDGLEPQDAVYVWDYRRWVAGLPIID